VKYDVEQNFLAANNMRVQLNKLRNVNSCRFGLVYWFQYYPCSEDIITENHNISGMCNKKPQLYVRVLKNHRPTVNM
jgi:hypothetical protein